MDNLETDSLEADSLETDSLEAGSLEAGSLEKPQVSEARLILDTYKAWQDIQQLLDGQLPQEGEDYGPWTLQMDLLRDDFESQGPAKVQRERV